MAPPIILAASLAALIQASAPAPDWSGRAGPVAAGLRVRPGGTGFLPKPPPPHRVALVVPAGTPFSAAAAPTRVGRASEWIADQLRTLGAWAPVSLVVLLVVTCVLCIPGAFLTLAAGALFGLALGFLCAWLGALLGAAAAFLVSRHLLREPIQRRIARHPRLAAIEEAVSDEGWRIVFLSRLAPGSPFFLLNYLFGLTRIRFLPYLGATAISMIPGTLLLVYVGSLGQFALSGRDQTVWDWALRGVGLAALVLAVVLITRRAKRALDAKLRRD